MDAAIKNGWKIFGIIMIVLLLAAAIAVPAYFIGRESDDEGQRQTTTAKTPAAGTPAPTGAGTEEAGEAAAPAPEETTGTVTTAEPAERYVVGEGEGSTPCIGGMRTTTRTTNWSDGSTDTVTVTEPCT